MNSRKQRVLIFGQKVFGKVKPKVSAEYCEVDILNFPEEYHKLSYLSDYDLVILDYAPFQIDKYVYIEQQEFFEKQMIQALDSGTTFCFLHYNHQVPADDQFSYETGGMREEEVKACRKTQLGFRWLYTFKVRPFKLDCLVLDSDLKRNEFKVFF